MAPKTLKRPAAAASGGAAKKLKAEKCDIVSTALQEAELPENVVSMFSNKVFLKACLDVPKEERHPYQEKAIAMLTEMMEGIEAGLGSAITDCEKTLADSDADKARKEAAEKSAEEAVEAKKTAAEEAKTAAADAVTAAKTAKDALATAKSAQATGDAEVDGAAGKKQRLEKAKENLAAIKAGTIETEKVSATVDELVAVAKFFKFDATMITTMPSALSKSPASRGAFDEMVFKQMEDSLGNLIGSFATTITNGDAGKAERANAVTEATAALEAAEATKTATGEAEAAAATALKDAKAAHKEAVKEVKGHDALMKQTEKDVETAKDDLEEFKTGPKVAFADLVAFTLVVPEEPEPPQDAEAPADAAAEPVAEPAPAA